MNKISLIGACVAAAIVFASEAIIYGTNGVENWMFEEPRLLAFNMIWVAAPFILFSFIKKRTRKRAIGMGLGLTAGAWIWKTWDGWSYITGAQGGGANIGLGIVMLLWPIFVFTMMMVLTIRRKWDMPHDGHFEDGIH